jgi:hypothetical protein
MVTSAIATISMSMRDMIGLRLFRLVDPMMRVAAAANGLEALQVLAVATHSVPAMKYKVNRGRLRQRHE